MKLWCFAKCSSQDFKFFCQEESFVFTLGAGAAPVIVTKADLAKSLEQLQQLPVKLHLRKVSEVAMSLVAALEVGRWDQCSVKESYGNLSKHDLQVGWLIFYFNSLSPWTLLLQPFDLMGKRYAVRLQQRVLVRALICSFSMQCLVEAESYPKTKPAAGNRLR